MLGTEHSTDEVKIIQMNLHKSRTATFDLINEPENANALSKTHDFVCIQEP